MDWGEAGFACSRCSDVHRGKRVDHELRLGLVEEVVGAGAEGERLNMLRFDIEAIEALRNEESDSVLDCLAVFSSRWQVAGSPAASCKT